MTMYARLKPKDGYLEAHCAGRDCGALLGFIYQSEGGAGMFRPALPRKHSAQAAPAPANRAQRLKLRAPLHRLQESARRLQTEPLPTPFTCERCGHEQVIDISAPT
jgi:hypothetical protein